MFYLFINQQSVMIDANTVTPNIFLCDVFCDQQTPSKRVCSKITKIARSEKFYLREVNKLNKGYNQVLLL